MTESTAPAPVLEIDDLHVYYGAIHALKGVSLQVPDGSIVDGPAGVRALLTGKPELFVSALTEKLMMYALGRNVQYYDAPAVRAVVRAAATRNYEFSAIVEGIVASVPFQMRAGHAAAEATIVARGEP